MKLSATFVKHHESDSWTLLYGPNDHWRAHKDFLKDKRFLSHHPDYSAILSFGEATFRKTFARGPETMSSSSSSSSDSSSSDSSSSSSSSTEAEETSSSSSSSTEAEETSSSSDSSNSSESSSSSSSLI